jgi:signal transduction histidine kinase
MLSYSIEKSLHIRIVKILNEIRPEYDYSVQADFIANGMLDSFDVISLVFALEKAFGIVIDGMDILPENLRSLSAIGNLVDNALEAAIQEEQGNRSVGIELKDEADGYLLYVYNTGPKIKNPEEIFLPGYTSNNSYGRGYGLYIVQRLVEGCGGYIKVNTVPRTTFVVHLPKEVNNRDTADKYQHGRHSGQAVGI